MAYIAESQIIRINSGSDDTEEGIKGTHTNFTIKLKIAPNNKFTHVALLRASIPRSFYIVDEPLNYFTLTEGLTDATITITPGNYTRKSLILEVIAQLNAGSPNGWTYSYTYPNMATQPDTGLYTFSVSGNTSQPSFTFTGRSMTQQLGFAEATYTFSSDSLTSPYVCNLAGRDNVLYLISDIAEGAQDSVLGSIITSSTPTMSYINYINEQVEETSLKWNGTHSSDTFYFKLVDEYKQAVDTKGNNIWFSLLLYRKR